MELYGFMEREKKIPSYFFIITKYLYNAGQGQLYYLNYQIYIQNQNRDFLPAPVLDTQEQRITLK